MWVSQLLLPPQIRQDILSLLANALVNSLNLRKRLSDSDTVCIFPSTRFALVYHISTICQAPINEPIPDLQLDVASRSCQQGCHSALLGNLLDYIQPPSTS